MTLATATAAMIPAGVTTLTPGVVVDTGDGLAVEVGGTPVPVTWPDQVVFAPGDIVQVAVHGSGRGGRAATVLGRVLTKPRPATGTVRTAPTGSDTYEIDADGVTYEAWVTSTYTPAVGDQVVLTWAAAKPVALGRLGATSTPPPAAPKPPPPPVKAAPKVTTGTGTFRATDSSTYLAAFGGWDRWNGGRGDVYQGNANGYDTRGAWFYGGAPGSLRGKTVTRIRFWVPPAVPGQGYPTTTLHLYLHTSARRPASDVTTTGAVLNVDWPGRAGGWITLPVSWAATLINGGGIAIRGNPYTGLLGRIKSPQSGQLSIDWRA